MIQSKTMNYPPLSSGAHSGDRTCTECKLQVVSPAWTSDIQYFAGEEKTGHDQGFHCLWIDFLKRHSAGGNLAMIKSARSSHLELEMS